MCDIFKKKSFFSPNPMLYWLIWGTSVGNSNNNFKEQNCSPLAQTSTLCCHLKNHYDAKGVG